MTYPFKREARVRINGRMAWYLYGPAGVMQFVLLGDLHPLPISFGTIFEFEDGWWTGMDIGVHSPKPLHDDHEPRDCPFLDGMPCYYDGTSLGGMGLATKWREAGFDDEVIWRVLEGYYWAWLLGEEVFPGDDE